MKSIELSPFAANMLVEVLNEHAIVCENLIKESKIACESSLGASIARCYEEQKAESEKIIQLLK